MDLPLVVLWELFEHLKQNDLVTLGSTSRELRQIVAPFLFAHIHINSSTVGFFKTTISKKYNKLCTSLLVDTGYVFFNYSTDIVDNFDALVNLRKLTLRGFDEPWKDPSAIVKEPQNILRLSVYNSSQTIVSYFKSITSLFLYRDGGVSVEMLSLDCPLQKLSFNLNEADANIMNQVHHKHPKLKQISIFSRIYRIDIPLICYDFEKKQILGLGWKNSKIVFNLDFRRDNIVETSLTPSETIGGLYTGLITKISKDEQTLRYSLPRLKKFSMYNYQSDLIEDLPSSSLVQYAESIYLGARLLNKAGMMNVEYSATILQLNNIDGRYPVNMFLPSVENLKTLKTLYIHRLTDGFWGDFDLPQLKSFTIKYVSRFNMEKVIQGAPLLTDIFCELGFWNCRGLKELYPRINIRTYADPNSPFFSAKNSLLSIFDQNA